MCDLLGLSEMPRRIEGFDVSNLQGGQAVASLVVCEEGKMRKKGYRSFNIRGLEGPDDYASLRQAVERRYRRRLEGIGTMPDLILIDGGRGQLNAALEALATLGVEETRVVALAKRDEELYLPERPEPVRVKRTHPGLRLLQRIRDEAHRFALSRHRRRRSARALASGLDRIPGIGPRRKKLLLRQMGSLRGVREASVEELQEVLGPRIGLRFYEELHSGTPATAG